jgi:competence protein ComEC
MTPRPVTGIVTDVERTENGLRITLDKVTINRLPEDQTPERVRLTLRLKQDAALEFPRVGSRIELLAGLLPPMGPAMPHGFDFARYFYFRGIGAVGYGLPPWKLLPELPRNGLVEQFVNWRIDLTESIITQLGPRHGPIAAGLITGEDRAIQETDYEALKAANLYHIIAISGGHMVVISGLVFLLARWLLLCLPGSLRYRPEMKSLAASITLALVTLYLFVTGMPPSAVRAYVMIALVLLAVMLRRQVDPMRSLVVAALIMLVLDPSDLFEPGFQLSFLATLAIVALVERIFMRPNLSATLPSRLGRLLLTTFLISLVAEAATAPLVIAQFNQFAIYGVPANMIATPLVSLLLMPVVALFFVLLPFGAEQPALWALNFGIEALLRIAHEVASWPQARIFLPSLPGWGLTMFVLGLLWFCFFLRRPRWLGVPVMAVGILSLYTNHVPDLLVGSEVKQIALRTDDGYMLARGRSDSMIPQLWANGLGHEELPAIGRKHTAWRCDRLGCVGVIDKKRIAFPTLPAAVLDDCRLSDVLVTPLRRLRCDHAWVISGWDLRHKGTHAFWLEDGRFRIETSADWQGKRPWSSQ